VLTHSTSAYAIELVDRSILRYTEAHPTYQAYRFFIEGDPAAILMIELRGNLPDDIHNQAQYMRSLLQGKGLGYAFPLILGPLTQQVWEVRKAGLGLIRNLPGDVQAVNLIEDCAVAVEDLPAYMQDVQKLLSGLGVQACYYAHAGAGEIHVEPFLNLKTKEGLHLFRQILAQCAQLVRQYRGSLSGEHGDGRLRGEYISRVLGSEAYALFAQIKNIFDPQGIFNKGKIVGAPAMDEHLRFAVGQPLQEEKTLLDFTKQESMLRLAEKCSGSGDCRKTHYSGGTMCPSFMATRQEKDTTRARANLLRQYWSQPPQVQDVDDEVVKSVLDLCLSCKACKMECPSQVDMTKLKAEFLQHYFDRRGVDRRSYWMARFVQLQKWASLWPSAYNWLIQHPKINLWIKSWMGIAKSRSLPLQAPKTLMHWARKEQKTNASSRKVYLLADEFTNYHDVPIGQAAYRLLQTLGYKVEILDLQDSGRAALSKGLLRYARQLAHKNLQKIQSEIPSNLPVIGIEPAALLTYRDEYPDLVSENWKPVALRWAKQCFMFEEFLMEEYKKGYITSENFTALPEKIQLHTHCYQKALGISHLSEQMLKIVPQLEVEVIPSGCCGMAGSFGYEEEHFEVSQQIAELVLLPALRQKHDKAVCAPGHSCRHQIKDALAVVALHPIEVLWRAVKK
jgi:Fe-S oxidoreductase